MRPRPPPPVFPTMRPPPIDDVIVAVSTSWAPSRIGVLRLSGPGSIELVAGIARDARKPGFQELEIEAGQTIPVRVITFRAPRSYTGQDVVEIHAPGSLPLLREVSARLIRGGARRALPGEFTVRAYLNHKITGQGVERVAALISASNQDAARIAAREMRLTYEPLVKHFRSVLLNVLAAIEAGIDFVDEEDVRFITGAQVATALRPLVIQLAEFERTHAYLPGTRPHVALAGLPNAGKSTLFNLLCGRERAIVSPLVGTTRDVLSAELHWGEIRFILQDCAGLGSDPDELEIASYQAAERTAEQADLVLWLHDCRRSWEEHESRVCKRIPKDRLMLVISQTDHLQSPYLDESIVAASATTRISCATGAGITELRAAIAAHLMQRSAASLSGLPDEFLLISAALERAIVLADNDPQLSTGELAALEIRSACGLLDRIERGPLVEEVLGRIFSTFCVGK